VRFKWETKVIVTGTVLFAANSAAVKNPLYHKDQEEENDEARKFLKSLNVEALWVYPMGTTRNCLPEH